MRTITEEQAAAGLEKILGIPKCPECGSEMEMWGAPRRWRCTVCKHEMPGPKVELERLEGE